MLSKKLLTQLNGQINAELYSSYLYLSMAAYFESANFRGLARWMRTQAGEEYGHAMKFYDYVIARGGKVELAAIAAPPTMWKSALDVFQVTLKHEQGVTARINALADLAAAEKDHATSVTLQWFISEQVEEEASATEIVERLKLIKDSTGGLFMLDHQLGKRGEK